MTPEEVYCLLKKDPSQQGGGGAGKPLDGHRPKPNGTTQGITAADVQQAASMCKAVQGTLPAGIDRLLGEIKKPSQSPWRRLRQFVTTSLSGYDASTWRRLQRRMIVRGVGMPGRVQQGAGVVGIVGDTSGSIDDAMLQLFGGHMAAIVDDARPQEIRVYWTDAKVHRVDSAKNSGELRKVLSSKIPGGGGTDMREGVQAAEADGCDSIVVLTDGYTPFCDSKKPLIWAITEAGKRSPYGETIHISG
jgi:predicted metal-dependent peptidase